MRGSFGQFAKLWTTETSRRSATRFIGIWSSGSDLGWSDLFLRCFRGERLMDSCGVAWSVCFLEKDDFRGEINRFMSRFCVQEYLRLVCL